LAIDHREFNNILLFHFGQLGDVVLALPAIRAIRERFQNSRLTIISGLSTRGVLELSGLADEQIAVDRVELRDGGRLRAIAEMLRIARDLRSRKFDLVIDIHSLYETNLLGYFSEAPMRYFAHRDRRSLQWLSNWPEKAPIENRSAHHFDRYAAAVRPLGIDAVEWHFTSAPHPEAAEAAAAILSNAGVSDSRLIGLFLGAGHETRRWPVDRFVSVAKSLAADDKNRVLVLLGPEERAMRDGLQEKFGKSAIVIEEVPLPVFFAILTKLHVMVSGDTGPMHMAAVAGAGVVLLSTLGAPDIFTPLTENLVNINDLKFEDIGVDRVIAGVNTLLK